jgi:hypothetical protein
MSQTSQAQSSPAASAGKTQGPPSALTRNIHDKLGAYLAQPPSPEVLSRMLRLLAQWRSTVLQNTIIAKDGHGVQAGPFKGMTYLAQQSEGALAPRLLGTYESALEPIIEKIIRRGYAQMIDVGCAEGYYAVGFARRMPELRVIARDMNPAAQQKCADLAKLNGVQNQIEIGGLFGHADFDMANHAKTVVICDIEGAEDQLLDPSLAPGLLAADILVEVHDCFNPGLSARLTQRFEASHNVHHIDGKLPPTEPPAWTLQLSELDQLLAQWEWRLGPTPWLWMTRKGKGGAKDGAEAGNPDRPKGKNKP